MGNEVLTFIKNFKEPATATAHELFLRGDCYWFAYILTTRFPRGEIYYLPIENHFITKIGSYYYDITGQIKPSEQPVKWNIFRITEPLEANRIERDCINKDYNNGL